MQFDLVMKSKSHCEQVNVFLNVFSDVKTSAFTFEAKFTLFGVKCSLKTLTVQMKYDASHSCGGTLTNYSFPIRQKKIKISDDNTATISLDGIPLEAFCAMCGCNLSAYKRMDFVLYQEDPCTFWLDGGALDLNTNYMKLGNMQIAIDGVGNIMEYTYRQTLENLFANLPFFSTDIINSIFGNIYISSTAKA